MKRIRVMRKPRFRQCGGKHAHKSYGAAEAQLRSLGDLAVNMESYACGWCKMWHVGHKRQKSR